VGSADRVRTGVRGPAGSHMRLTRDAGVQGTRAAEERLAALGITGPTLVVLHERRQTNPLAGRRVYTRRRWPG
jgi:hypothetical protein